MTKRSVKGERELEGSDGIMRKLQVDSPSVCWPRRWLVNSHAKNSQYRAKNFVWLSLFNFWGMRNMLERRIGFYRWIKTCGSFWRGALIVHTAQRGRVLFVVKLMCIWERDLSALAANLQFPHAHSAQPTRAVFGHICQVCWDWRRSVLAASARRPHTCSARPTRVVFGHLRQLYWDWRRFVLVVPSWSLHAHSAQPTRAVFGHICRLYWDWCRSVLVVSLRCPFVHIQRPTRAAFGHICQLR